MIAVEKMICLKKIGSENIGYLSFFEGNRDIDFSIKRIYYIYGVEKDNLRGSHAHKSLKQILWCPYGAVEVKAKDGSLEKSYILDCPEKALILSGGVWRTILWLKESSVLCAAVSDYFDEEDYIRNYEDYLEYIKKGYWDYESKV